MTTNVGSSSLEEDENGQSFLNKAKCAMKSLVLKKV